MISVTKDIAIDDREVKERFVRSAGPASQNLRKEATAAELRFDIAASSLPTAVKDELFATGGRWVTTDGVLVVVSRVFRSQMENREAARARFVAILRRAATPPAARTRTRPRAAVRAKRSASKQAHSAVKRSRRPARGAEN